MIYLKYILMFRCACIVYIETKLDEIRKDFYLDEILWIWYRFRDLIDSCFIGEIKKLYVPKIYNNIITLLMLSINIALLMLYINIASGYIDKKVILK